MMQYNKLWNDEETIAGVLKITLEKHFEASTGFEPVAFTSATAFQYAASKIYEEQFQFICISSFDFLVLSFLNHSSGDIHVVVTRQL